MEIKIFCKYDELINPSKLKNHPKNRNKHGQDQVERLAELYKYHGIRHPIIVSNLSKCIVAGHGRKLAAIRAGIKEMPVVYQDFESSESEYAFIQADNAIALWAELDMAGINSDIGDLGPDFDINMLGIQDFTLDVAEKDFEGDPDEIPEDIEPQAKLGQIYKLGDHRLMCGDSTDEATVSALMSGKNADMLLTDPPYNYGSETDCSKQNTGDIQLKDSEWDKNFSPNVVKFFDYLSDDFSAYIFTSCFLFGETFELAKKSSDFAGMMCWKKTTYNSNPIKKHPTWNIEPIVYCTKGKHHFDYDNSEAKNALLEFAGEHSTRFVGHPSQKPVKMFETIIKNSSRNLTNVLDLFGGSGSTLIACEKTNRKCFMMELDPHYIDVIIARWEKFTGKKAELLNG